MPTGPASTLRSCRDLNADSLEPVAHISPLRELRLEASADTAVQPICQLLSSAVQGCLLRIQVHGYNLVPAEWEGCMAAKASLAAEKGSRNVPSLELVLVRPIVEGRRAGTSQMPSQLMGGGIWVSILGVWATHAWVLMAALLQSRQEQHL
jgi:hypothetical protein